MMRAAAAWLTECWISYRPLTTERNARRRAHNAFEIGYDAGEARLRERITKDASR